MRISDWSSDVCSSDLHGEQVPHRTRRTIPTRRRDADRHRGRDRLLRRCSCQEQYEMNYSEFQPGLKARAATAALAVTTSFTVISLGPAPVTAEPARAQGLASTVRAAPMAPSGRASVREGGGRCGSVSGGCGSVKKNKLL